jgi:hypothetical protein
MCNKRQVKIIATQQLSEAWQREVTRTVQLSGRVTGEARVQQPLDGTLGGPALQALETALSAEDSGWRQTPEGFRCDVEGGYVLYLVDERALEIVAVLEDSIQVSGEARRELTGTMNEAISVEAVGQYYDDGYGGWTKENAHRQAQIDADKKLQEAARARAVKVQEEAESKASGLVEAEARSKAEEQLRQEAEQRRMQLAAQAQNHLETVGVRCRQAFHQVLARAYRDSILAYARKNGAENIVCSDAGDTVEIEFCLRN